MPLFAPDKTLWQPRRRLFVPSYVAQGNPPVFGANGADGSFGTSTPLNLAVPSGMVAGETAIAFIQQQLGGSVTLPGNWYAAPGSPVASGDVQVNVLYHKATGNESGSYSFTVTAGYWRNGFVSRYSNVADTPFETYDSATGTSNPTPAVALTSAIANELLLWVTLCNNDHYGSPAGWTLRHNGSGNGRTLAELNWPNPGNTGDITATMSGSGDDHAIWMGALKPAS